VLFGLENKILHDYPHFLKKKMLGQFSTGLEKFRVKKASTMAMFICKLLLIGIVAP